MRARAATGTRSVPMREEPMNEQRLKRLVKYLRKEPLAPPPAEARATWPPLMFDRLGDCTIAPQALGALRIPKEKRRDRA